MSVEKLGIWVPEDYDREAEELLTEFRHFIDSDEVEATFNVYPSTLDNGVLIGWDLEAVGLVTWHRASSLEEAEAWVREQTVPWITTNGRPKLGQEEVNA